MAVDLALASIMVGSSVASALAAVLAMHVLSNRRQAGTPIWTTEDEHENDAVFLFDDDRLVDANDAGRALLDGAPPLPTGVSDWHRLSACLAPRFPDLTERMSHLAQEGRIELTSEPEDGTDPAFMPGSALTPPEPSAQVSDAMTLFAEWRDGMARIMLRTGCRDTSAVYVDRLSLRMTAAELGLLRALAECAPAPAWHTDAGGRVVWINSAYLDLLTQLHPEVGLRWPVPTLFPACDEPSISTGRVSLDDPALGRPRWFDVRHIAFRGGWLSWAVPADDTVTAEARLADFRRTLTRSFADLPVGLAIFDSRRRLHVFNPALTDLTQLEVSFLSGRPSLEVFLDRLREQQMLPEPEDYNSWRRRLTDLETAAATSGYRETWSLPCGQTFRVTGHPHPDGAVAFLFEDITAEMSLQRRFRAEIEYGQSALDAMSEAIIVFAPSGHAVLSNAAYARLWQLDPLRIVAEIGLPETLRNWQSRTRNTPDWARLRATVAAASSRTGWTETVELTEGRRLRMRVAGLPRGATLVGFSPDDSSAEIGARYDHATMNGGMSDARFAAILPESRRGDPPAQDEPGVALADARATRAVGTI